MENNKKIVFKRTIIILFYKLNNIAYKISFITSTYRVT